MYPRSKLCHGRIALTGTMLFVFTKSWRMPCAFAQAAYCTGRLFRCSPCAAATRVRRQDASSPAVAGARRAHAAPSERRRQRGGAPRAARTLRAHLRAAAERRAAAAARNTRCLRIAAHTRQGRRHRRRAACALCRRLTQDGRSSLTGRSSSTALWRSVRIRNDEAAGVKTRPGVSARGERCSVWIGRLCEVWIGRKLVSTTHVAIALLAATATA
eukprot:6180349-Pleurochrysis_carterae.AAC.4